MARVTELTETDRLLLTFNDGTAIELKKPNKTHLGAVLAASRKDVLAGSDALLKQCQVAGPVGLSDKATYAHQVVKALPEIFGQQYCILVWEDGVAKVEFADGATCVLREPTRAEYSAAMAASRINPLRYVEDMLRTCWISGEEAVRTSAGHLLGFTEVIDELLSPTSERLGN